MKLGLVLGLANIAAAEDYLNILAVDGGGIRGLIPAVVIQRMEQHAYKHAEEKGYFDKIGSDFVNDELKAVHMSKVFDFTAGTSTGSILAAGLAKPLMIDGTDGKKVSTGKPRFWALELLNIYKEKGD